MRSVPSTPKDSGFRGHGIPGTLTDFEILGEIQQIPGTPAREEDFTLDPTGNWGGYVQKASGTTVLDQDREHNMVNEIDVDEDHSNTPGASITASTGTNWYDPSYDAAGNMTGVPKPGDPANGLPYTYL